MKRSLKGIAILTASLLALAMLTWVAIFLYWHIRIGKTIRFLEHRRMAIGARPPDVCEAHDFLGNLECRSMPYLAAELDPAKIPEFIWAASNMMAFRSETCRGPLTGDEWPLRVRRRSVQPEDSADTVRQKIEFLRSWWAEHAARHHPWWRVWSYRCDAGG